MAYKTTKNAFRAKDYLKIQIKSKVLAHMRAVSLLKTPFSFSERCRIRLARGIAKDTLHKPCGGDRDAIKKHKNVSQSGPNPGTNPGTAYYYSRT